MDYNTQRPKMVIPEYGRNVQNMISFAMSVSDRDERNKVAQAIIKVMGQLNPQLRDVEDYNHKLWAHLFIMSNFELDVDSPYPIPSPETFLEKPNRVAYPQSRIKYGHYGKTVELLIEKAKLMEDENEKEALTFSIANLMKRFYITYNRDNVNDDVIFHQLEELSKGELKLKNPRSLLAITDIAKPNKTYSKTNKKGGRPIGKSNHSNSSNYKHKKRH